MSCGPAPDTLTVHSNFDWALDNPEKEASILNCDYLCAGDTAGCNYDRNYNDTKSKLVTYEEITLWDAQ